MELRKDYLLDRWVIISERRAERPREFKKEAVKAVERQLCYFCPGNEHLTPPEIWRDATPWSLRVFPNKFPAAALDGPQEIRTDNRFYTFSSSFGRHEVVAETPRHDQQLWDLTEDEIFRLLGTFAARVRSLNSFPETKYIVIFKNHGKEAGTSLVHSHSQIISMNIVPALIHQEIVMQRSFESCPYCDIVEGEKGSFRRCFENATFSAFTPYASRYNYEIWIFPKAHITTIEGFNDTQRRDLAKILRQVLGKLKEIDSPYNLAFHITPKGESLHFHIEVCPRLSTFAGFEICSDVTINSVSPETAAKFYRGEL